MCPSGFQEDPHFKEGAAFYWKVSSPTDMCILKLDLKMEVRLAKISSLLDFQKLQTCCLVTIYCPFLHRFWPANLVESESVYNEMLHLWIICFRRLVICYACFYKTCVLHLFSAKVMVFSELWTCRHIAHLEGGNFDFSEKYSESHQQIFLRLFWWSPNENENAKWGDVGRLAKRAQDVIREKQKEICNVWTKTIKRYTPLKSLVLHQDKTTIN